MTASTDRSWHQLFDCAAAYEVTLDEIERAVDRYRGDG